MELIQIAWVVKDIEAAETYFRDVMGIDGFVRVDDFCAGDYEGTYYGQPSDAAWRVSSAYCGGAFIELIQPVSGRSIFQDYLDKNPAGGLQHIAYNMPIAKLEEAVSAMTGKGYRVITSVNMPVAKICFLDTYEQVGVVTEMIGLTEEGVRFVENMKKGGAAENKRLMQGIFSALSEGDDQPFLDAMAEGMQWHWMGSGQWSKTFDGKTAVLNELWSAVRATLRPPYKAIPQQFIADTEHVVIEATGKNSTIDGKAYNNRYCWVCRIKDGKLWELREYMDTDLVTRTFL